MSLSFVDFMSQLFTNPVLAVTVLLTLGVVLVNGWTDAPNAIATCVSTRSIVDALRAVKIDYNLTRKTNMKKIYRS
jgi:hypothetical protein